MGIRAGTSSLIAGCIVASRYAGHGILGADIPPTSIFANDLTIDPAKEYRYEVTSVPFGLHITVNEDGTYIATADADGTYVVEGTAYEDGVAFGTPTITLFFGDVGIVASGIPSAEAFGEPAIAAAVAPAGVASAEAFGSPSVAAVIAAASIASGEAFGVPEVGDHVIVATGIASAEAFGVPTVGDLPAPAASPNYLGGGPRRPRLKQPRATPAEVRQIPAHALRVVGIGSEEAFGRPSVVASLGTRSVGSSDASFGRPRVRRLPTTAQLIDEMAWLMQR